MILYHSMIFPEILRAPLVASRVSQERRCAVEPTPWRQKPSDQALVATTALWQRPYGPVPPVPRR